MVAHPVELKNNSSYQRRKRSRSLTKAFDYNDLTEKNLGFWKSSRIRRFNCFSEEVLAKHEVHSYVPMRRSNQGPGECVVERGEFEVAAAASAASSASTSGLSCSS